MKTIQKLMLLLSLTGICMAQPASSDGEPVAKKSKVHHVAKKSHPKVRSAASAEDIRQLKEKIETQQSQIDQLRQQSTQHDQQTQQAQQVAIDAQKSAAAAQEKVAATDAVVADTNTKVDAVKSDVVDLKSSTASAVIAVQDTQKQVYELETPKQIHYKNINITPGGFLAAESLWRQHTENADIGSSFNGIPYANSTQYSLTEWRGTARQSRLSLLAEGKAGAAKLTGYYEMDFLGAAATANENQSNSFQPRIRQVFGKVALNGWSLTAGQTWSLLTTDKKGIDARSEWVPATIDAQYVVGYDWARLMTVRLAKTFADDKATFAFSIENPAMLVAGQIPVTSTGATVTTPVFGGTGSGQLGNGNTYSANLAPDLIAKIAFDPGYGHYEIKAVGRFFRDRIGEVVATATTPGAVGSSQTTYGGGVGASAILPVVKNKVDVIVEGLAGRGIARYGDSSNADVTYRPDGSLSPIQNVHALAGIEAQPTPKLNLYAYAGDEYLGRDTFTTATGVTSGFGLKTGPKAVSNASCFLTNNNTCSALMKNLVQGTAGFWFNVYKGGFGMLRYGMQYSYTYKDTWAGSGALPNAPKAIENMAFTSLRYYLP